MKRFITIVLLLVLSLAICAQTFAEERVGGMGESDNGSAKAHNIITTLPTDASPVVSFTVGGMRAYTVLVVDVDCDQGGDLTITRIPDSDNPSDLGLVSKTGTVVGGTPNTFVDDYFAAPMALVTFTKTESGDSASCKITTSGIK